MRRRDFITRTGLLLGASTVSGWRWPTPAREPRSLRAFDPADWQSVRDQFELDPSLIHMASFLLASHPRPVAEMVERHRRGLDNDPATHWHDHFQTAEPDVRAAAGEYLGVDPALIALTDSTTMGLGLVYGGLRLQPGQEILTTPHDHYATIKSLALRAERTGARVRRVSLYDDPAQTTTGEVVDRMRRAVTDRTRVLAVTWVHSSTGVKLPLAAMSEVLDEINARRDEEDRILFCVDGVHGLGIEDVTMPELGCDFFIAGTHKWLFAPRGTGLVYGRREAWKAVDPIIPSFGPSVGVWLGLIPEDSPYVTPGSSHTPGGFHSFEHRWAVGEAFRFHQQIGKARVQRRIHDLNTMAKEALAAMPRVHLLTPMRDELSSGVIAFQVDGYDAGQVVERLRESAIIASASPYPVSNPRIAPSLVNDEDEVRATVRAIGALA